MRKSRINITEEDLVIVSRNTDVSHPGWVLYYIKPWRLFSLAYGNKSITRRKSILERLQTYDEEVVYLAEYLPEYLEESRQHTTVVDQALYDKFVLSVSAHYL